MGTIGDQAPDRPRTERIRCPHGDDHPEPAGARRFACEVRSAHLSRPDETGALLEVMAIETDRGLLVIHAMTMRAKYRIHLKGDDDANT
jgi:hypothetical protein